jgi:hypothetical protein
MLIIMLLTKCDAHANFAARRSGFSPSRNLGRRGEMWFNFVNIISKIRAAQAEAQNFFALRHSQRLLQRSRLLTQN